MKLDLFTPGPASLRVSTLLEAKGSLSVADGVVVFARDPGMAGWGAPPEGPRFPLAALDGVSVSGGVLTLHAGADQAQFSGPHAVAFGLGLQAAGLLGAGSTRSPGMLWFAPVTMIAGLLRGAGVLVLGAAGLWFGTSSGVAESLGIPPWSAPWRWVTGLSAAGRQVHLTGTDGAVAFELDDPAGLTRMVARGIHVPATPLGPPRALWVGGGVLQLGMAEVHPGVAWVEPDGGLRFGAAVGERALGTGDRAIRVEGGNGSMLRDHSDGWLLRLRDSAAVDAFEAEVVKVIGGHRGGAPRADLRMVVGRRERVRFRDEQGARPTLPLVWIEDGEAELDVFTTHAAGVPPIGEAVQLIIPTRSGDLRLLTRCGEVHAIPVAEAPRGAQTAFKGADQVLGLRLRRPLGSELQELKDRGGFRLELGLLDTQLRPERGPSVDVQIVDLSASGAALRVPRVLEVGAGLHLRIPMPEIAAPVRVEVVWSRVVGDAPQAGVRFMDESEQFRARVQRAIYRMQRAQIEVADEEPTAGQRPAVAEDSSTALLRALQDHRS